MVVVLGADVHKRSHTIVAVEVGAKLGEKTVPATDAGHDALLRWARRDLVANTAWGNHTVDQFLDALPPAYETHPSCTAIPIRRPDGTPSPTFWSAQSVMNSRMSLDAR